MRIVLIAGAIALLTACSPNNETSRPSKPTVNSVADAQERFSVITAGTTVGDMIVDHDDTALAITFQFKNNGRGPSMVETVALDENAIPIQWSVKGNTTFGNEVEETFGLDGTKANWRDAGGDGEATLDEPALYVSQFASPYAAYIYARALLNDDDAQMPALPAGSLRLREIETLSASGTDGTADITSYALSGADINPDYLLLDSRQTLFAYVTPRFIVVRDGFEAQEKRLRDLAARYNAERYEDIQSRFARVYTAPVRIRNVRVFDPETLALTDPVSVTIKGETIASIDAPDAVGIDGEIDIEGNGGTLVPGLYDMHAHMSDNAAILNLLAGVTSVRDTGNEIDVLEPLREKIESGSLAGPRISMSGFIEGKSETNNATGELATTQEEAVDLVNMYADRGGYHQIKIYSSIKGEWVPAMAKAAHARGMRVSGHIPAFSTPDEMIEAGYDEITHINQVMLSWVLAPEDDTRTLKRITGMRAFAGLDLNDEAVQRTLNLMAENNIAADPTAVIHEFGLLARNGETRIGMQDYVDHMPIAVQRNSKVALLNVADAAEDADYRAAFDKVIETLSLMHERGIFLVPGTDLGGQFNLHREVELFGEIGFTPAEALRRANYDMADYLGFAKTRGSIKPGKLADFFLVPGDPTVDLKAIKTISMVSRGGVIYFPSEIYPEFGIKPFTDMPVVREK